MRAVLLRVRRRDARAWHAAGHSGGGASARQLQRQPVQPDRDRHGRGARLLRARSGRVADRRRPSRCVDADGDGTVERRGAGCLPRRQAGRDCVRAASRRRRCRAAAALGERVRWPSCPGRPGSTRRASKPRFTADAPAHRTTPTAQLTFRNDYASRPARLAGDRRHAWPGRSPARTPRRSPLTARTRCASIRTTCSPARSTSARRPSPIAVIARGAGGDRGRAVASETGPAGIGERLGRDRQRRRPLDDRNPRWRSWPRRVGARCTPSRRGTARRSSAPTSSAAGARRATPSSSG